MTGKTPITDLMAYHLSQLSSEVALEPSLSQEIQSTLLKTNSFNSHEFQIVSKETLLASIQSIYLDTFKQHVQDQVILELQGVADNYQKQIDFDIKDHQIDSKWTDVDLTEIIHESWSAIGPKLSSLLQPRLDGILAGIKESANESLAHELQKLTDKVKQIKNEPPATVKKVAPPTPSRSEDVKPIPTTTTQVVPAVTTPNSKPIPPVKSKTDSSLSQKHVPPSQPTQPQPSVVAQVPVAVEKQAQPGGAEKHSKPGFMKMLNHLTKSRPKVKRKDNKTSSTEQQQEEEEDTPQESIDSLTNNDESISCQSSQEISSTVKTPSPISPNQSNVQDTSKEEEQEHEPPSMALSALASVMMSGRANPTSPSQGSKESIPSNSESSLNSAVPSLQIDTSKPKPAIKPKPPVPLPSSSIEDKMTSPERQGAGEGVVKPSPPKKAVKYIPEPPKETSPTSTIHQGDAPVPVPRTSFSSAPAPRPKSESIGSATSATFVTAEAKRPYSVAVDSSITEELESTPTATSASNNTNATPAPVPTPRRIPGVFAGQHGAIGALAAAVTGKRTSGSHMEMPPLSTTNVNVTGTDATNLETSVEEGEHHPTVSPDRPLQTITPQVAPIISQVPLTFKKKDTSLSGDDKGIEKSALEWLNSHLASKDIQVSDIYSSLGDGLNLIYALEDATKESIGKYNKRTILPVHRIDNISVALNFLSRKGVDVGSINPQEIMDCNKGKILTLFNNILKSGL